MKANFPDIDYLYWKTQRSWEDRGSIKRMISLLYKKKLISHEISHENIIDEISRTISDYMNSKDDKLLLDIFTYIQAWGGASARIHTANIILNWEKYFERYKYAVKLILEKSFVDAFDFLTSKDGKIKGLGSSFIPKHICFWSGNGRKEDGIPILDDVISKMIYNKKAADVSYKIFIQDIVDFAMKSNLKASEIEKALFAFAQNYWSTSKTRTDCFRESISDFTDYEIAKEMIKS